LGRLESKGRRKRKRMNVPGSKVVRIKEEEWVDEGS